MGFWQTVLLILKHWPQVVAFVSYAHDVADKMRVQAAVEQLRESFNEQNTIEETAKAAANINDTFSN